MDDTLYVRGRDTELAHHLGCWPHRSKRSRSRRTDPWSRIERRLDCQAAVALLPLAERWMVLRWLSGDTQTEIAADMDLTQGTVCRRLSAAFDLMQRLLDPEYDPQPGRVWETRPQEGCLRA